jgi:F1F0 ATPase subunit 2
MMMSNLSLLILSGVAGTVLGGLFFASLWWTVHRGAVSPYPMVWFLGGMLVRAGAALTGIFLVGGHSWSRLLACLAGFVVARLAVTWSLERGASGREQKEIQVVIGNDHAP